MLYTSQPIHKIGYSDGLQHHFSNISAHVGKDYNIDHPSTIYEVFGWKFEYEAYCAKAAAQRAASELQ